MHPPRTMSQLFAWGKKHYNAFRQDKHSNKLAFYMSDDVCYVL